MSFWVSGVLALAGVITGAVLTDILIRRRNRRETQELILRAALTAVVKAQILARFPYSVDGRDAPKGVKQEDLRSFEVETYLKSVGRYFDALAEARSEVASLSQFGVDTTKWVESDDFMQQSLPSIQERIVEELYSNRHRRVAALMLWRSPKR